MPDLQIRIGGAIPEGLVPRALRVEYESVVDGRHDGAVLIDPSGRNDWVVFLHGHGGGPQILWTRHDLRCTWMASFLGHGFGILAPDLRGNAWMCPAAVADLHALLASVRAYRCVSRFIFASASMGGTGNLIYAICHPEDVAGVAALCPATDIATYYRWCRARNTGVLAEIADAIEGSYGGSPEQRPDVYRAHSVLEHTDRITMPLFIVHGTADDVIPVAESRRLIGRLATREQMVYIEVAHGRHDSPLPMIDQVVDWLDEEVCGATG